MQKSEWVKEDEERRRNSLEKKTKIKITKQNFLCADFCVSQMEWKFVRVLSQMENLHLGDSAKAWKLRQLAEKQKKLNLTNERETEIQASRIKSA